MAGGKPTSILIGQIRGENAANSSNFGIIRYCPLTVCRFFCQALTLPVSSSDSLVSFGNISEQITWIHHVQKVPKSAKKAE